MEIRLMVLETQEEILTEIQKLSKHYPEIEKVLLYGSRARSDHHRTSDFDLAIVTNDRWAFNNLYSDIDEMNTYFSFDMIDYNKIGNEVFLKNIQKDGIVIYERC